MSHCTHMNESCHRHSYEWVMAHIRISHGTSMNNFPRFFLVALQMTAYDNTKKIVHMRAMTHMNVPWLTRQNHSNVWHDWSAMLGKLQHDKKTCDSSMCACSSTLQHTATHCNTLQRTVTHCNRLQHTATHCNTQSPRVTFSHTHAHWKNRCLHIFQHT